jgi:hypothetical protein
MSELIERFRGVSKWLNVVRKAEGWSDEDERLVRPQLSDLDEATFDLEASGRTLRGTYIHHPHESWEVTPLPTQSARQQIGELHRRYVTVKEALPPIGDAIPLYEGRYVTRRLPGDRPSID